MGPWGKLEISVKLFHFFTSPSSWVSDSEDTPSAMEGLGLSQSGPSTSAMEDGGEGDALLVGGNAVDSEWKFPIAKFLERKTTDEELRGLHKRHLSSNSSASATRIVKYYKNRNVVIDSLAEVDKINLFERDGRDTQSSSPFSVWLIRLSLGTNVLLLVTKVAAAVLSGSLAIIASALDSLLDITSGTILYVTNHAMRRPDIYKYPVGKTRMEPLGIIVFSSMMGTIGLSVIVEAIRQFMGPEHTHHLEHLNVLVALVVLTVGAKFVLFLLCRRVKDETVQVLARDHLNDVFMNALGIMGAVLGDRVASWIDPLTAIILAAYITRVWGATAYEHIIAMVGLSADPYYLQKLTFLSANHHPSILQVDTVRAYTFGKRLFAEVDLVLPGEMTLRDAHDIGESLQEKIESLPEIERAFVHLDYETNHRPEHRSSTSNYG